jgi:hypothetical protein
MIENVAEVQRLDKKRIRWVTRLAQVFYGLVEVAVPDSVPHLIFRHWLKLLYLFELLTVVAGIVFVNQALNQFGMVAFGSTVAAHAAVRVLGDALRGRHVFVNLLLGLLIAFVVLMAALGVFSLFALLGSQNVWDSFEKVQKFAVRQQPLKKTILIAAIALFFLVSIWTDLLAIGRGLKARLSSLFGRKKQTTESRGTAAKGPR